MTVIHESSSVVIARLPSDVWDFVADLSMTPTWRTTVTSIDPPEALRVGGAIHRHDEIDRQDLVVGAGAHRSSGGFDARLRGRGGGREATRFVPA